MYVFANLTREQIKEIQELEYSEGIRLLALKEVKIEPDLISAEKLAALNELERKLGVCLLAVR
jgi:hypothetical protein